MPRWKKLAIISGGGNLPLRLATSCQAGNNQFLMIGLEGYADEAIQNYPYEYCNIAEIGKLIRILKNNDCDSVVMAGIVPRPDFSKLRPDWRAAALAPKIISAARKGDGAVLEVLVSTFEAEGFLVIGAEEVADSLFAPKGAIGKYHPNEKDFQDMRKALDVIRALGQFDIGQGAVIRNGLVLAIEAAEGTDEMLTRCAHLPTDVKGYEPEEERVPRGVILKTPKPDQELRVDLPTIGIETVRKVVQAGLAGIAIEAEAGLIIDKDTVAQEADQHGIFVYGFQRQELNHYNES
ncbi:MAG: LpxI family protein [bacterium]